MNHAGELLVKLSGTILFTFLFCDSEICFGLDASCATGHSISVEDFNADTSEGAAIAVIQFIGAEGDGNNHLYLGGRCSHRPANWEEQSWDDPRSRYRYSRRC